jgi:transcriptional regulator with GAF, ATPase, and Fis domain
MSTSGEMPAKSTSGHVRRPGVEETPPRDEIVVQRTWPTGPHAPFEDFLAALSATMATVVPDDMESEIARWLDQLAEHLAAERCTVGEFNAGAHAGFHVQWLVGKDPTPFIRPEDSWIQRRLASGQSISISTLDELPAEAVSTRQELEEMGVRSGLWVPIMAEGSAVGGIGLTVMSHEQHWPALVIRRCQIVANMIGDAFLRRRKTKEIEERSQFEALITDFSARFMNFDADIDVITDEVLGELGEFLRTDRVGYLEIDARKQSLIPTRQWFAQGIEQDRSMQYVDVSAQFPWLTAKIIRNESITIDEMDQFPDEATNERRYCENLGIQSFTMVPATLGGETVAALALDNFNSPQIWTDGIVQRLQIVAGIIASGQHRARQQRQLEETQCFERAVSKVSTAFVNLPPETVDDEIENGLGLVAEALGADLVTLLQPQGDTGYEVTHEWSSNVFDRYHFKGRQVHDDSWLAHRLRENETLAFSTLSGFPAEAANERAAMEQVGLESVLWVPFNVRGELAGHLAINTVRQRTWSKELVPQLRLLGEVFGEALSRRDAEMGLQKSFKEIEALKEQLQQENLYLRRKIQPTYGHDEIVGNSAALRATLTKVEQVAPTDSTVLILGDTGTGKELIARAIHENSARRDKLMVKVNCAALPSSLVEAELFGREKGAYTGALSRELGRFEIADGSTILLDEIAELSLELQAKLLRVLQDGEFERLGSSKTRHVDVRVLAATNRDLTKAMEKKEFREDLFYRLNVFPIRVPPLRERVEDIPQLVWAFVQEFSQTMGKNIETIPLTSMESLKAYGWPGNVREVRNIIERAMIVSQGPTLEIELPTASQEQAGSDRHSAQRLADVEREHIRAVVESTGWRIRGADGAAEILGLKPTTLEARMKKLGLGRTSTE